MPNEKKLRVLHAVGGSLDGGAAKGAINLHNALISQGISSFVINNYENKNVENLLKRGASKIKIWLYDHIDKIPLYFYFNRKKLIFSPGIFGENILPAIEKLNIDILHLHWINTGFINISDLSKIGIPIVWTLRDAWSFTGGCHMPMNCSKFINQCNKCEQLNSNHVHDISFFLKNRKKNIISRLDNITFIAISPFLQSQAKQSDVLKAFNIDFIENSVDIDKFKLSNKDIARDELGLSKNKTIILIGNDSGEAWKGYDFLYKLNDDISSENIQIISFGSGKPCHDGINFGFVKDTTQLALIYSAIDVFVFPSTYEPFGKSLFEASSCGAKIVSFKSTGSADFYENEEWWYLADYADYESLLTNTLLACDSENNNSLREVQRSSLLSKFEQEKIALKHINLYTKVHKKYND